MARLYDICYVVFENNEGKSENTYCAEIQDFSDYIEIKTNITFEGIDRGWMGNITFVFQGFDVENYSNGHNVSEERKLNNVLCSKRVFNKYDASAIEWTYTFLKY